jgi:hypothetical protein
MRVAIIPALLGLLLSPMVPAHAQPDLGWLVGHWCAEDADKSSEEHWLPLRGGLMLGLGRSVAKESTHFEFLRIEFSGTTARYVAQPDGAPPTIFQLVDSDPGTVTFTNPQHDFPKRIRYTRTGETLSARVDDGTNEGTALEFKWHRCTKAH